MATTVDISGLERLFHELDDGDGDRNARIRNFCKRFPSEVAKRRRQVGVRPVPVNGSTKRGLRMGYFMAPLRDGTQGYLQRRVDDCLQAAIATYLQIPPYKVPDLRIEELLDAGKDPDEIEHIIGQKMRPWAMRAGIDLMFHSSLPTTERRWIGVVSGGDEGFMDHCLIMNRQDSLFDGASLLPSNKDRPVTQHDPADIEHGITVIERSW